MNLVVDEAVEIRKDKSQKFLGIVVSYYRIMRIDFIAMILIMVLNPNSR